MFGDAFGSFAGGLGSTYGLYAKPVAAQSDPQSAPGIGAAAQPVATDTTNQQAASNAPAAPPQYQPIIAGASSQYGVPSDVLTKQLAAENNFKPTGTSNKGATGIAQFLPSTARDLGVDPNDPKSAIPGAAKYDSQLLQRYNGNMAHAIAAYNWGMGNVDKWLKAGADPAKLPAETRGYVSKILGPDALGTQTAQATGPAAAKEWQPPDLGLPKTASATPPAAAQPGIGRVSNPGLAFAKAINTTPAPKAPPIPKVQQAEMPKYDYQHDPVLQALNAQGQRYIPMPVAT